MALRFQYISRCPPYRIGAIMQVKEGMMFKKILVTMDGSPASEAILSCVQRFADKETEITLFSAVEPAVAIANERRPLVAVGAPAPGGVVSLPGTKMPETRGQAIERVERDHLEYLEGLAEPLRQRGLNVTTAVAMGHDAGDEIIKAARELEVDAIFMATHGRTALGQIVFGSMAQKVMHSGVCPVLMVRPDKLN
jgi:nucleotide-binding universal stress UspA family protein